MKYRDFCIPGDLCLAVRTLGKLLYYLLIIRIKSVDRYVERIKEPVFPQQEIVCLSVYQEETLRKVYRLCNLFLIRLMRSKKPCLPRTLVLHSWCRNMGLEAGIVIGVKKNSQGLTGHSWLILQGTAFMESEKELSEYTHIIEGRGK